MPVLGLELEQVCTFCGVGTGMQLKYMTGSIRHNSWRLLCLIHLGGSASAGVQENNVATLCDCYCLLDVVVI